MSNSSQPASSFDTLTVKSIEDIIKDCTIDLGATGASSEDITVTFNSSQYSDPLSTITLTPTYASIGVSGGTYTLGSGTITIDSIDTSSFVFNLPKEWVDTFPEWARVQDMCEQYPGLKIAFDNFKVFYEMVKDDYDNPTPKK